MIMQIKSTSHETKTIGEGLTNIAGETVSDNEKMLSLLESNKQNVQISNSELHSFTSAVHSVTEVVNTITTAMENQATTVNRTSAAIENMGSTIKKLATVIESKRRLYESLLSTTHSGISKMKQAVAAVDTISRFAQDIFEVTTLMKEISDQIDIHAINAAIEATHAGEAGMGFTVVAREIRKLANQTRQNVAVVNESLSKTVTDIQLASSFNRDASNSFEVLTQGIDDFNNSMNEILGSMDKLLVENNNIVESVNTLLTISKQINLSTHGMQEQFNEINNRISHISESSNNVMANIANLSSSVSDITDRMKNLSETGRANRENIRVLDDEINRFQTD